MLRLDARWLLLTMILVGLLVAGCKQRKAPPPPDAAKKAPLKKKVVDPDAGPAVFVVITSVKVGDKLVPHLVYRSSVDFPEPLIERLKLNDAKDRTPLAEAQIKLIKNFRTHGKVWIFPTPAGEACRAKVNGVLVLTESFPRPVLAGPLSGCADAKGWAPVGVTGTFSPKARWATMSWSKRKPLNKLAATSPVKVREAALQKLLDASRQARHLRKAKELAVKTQISAVRGAARAPEQALEELGISWYYPRKAKEAPEDGCDAEGGKHREFIVRQWGVRTRDGAFSVGQTRVYAASKPTKADDLHVIGGLTADGWFTHVVLNKPDTFFFDIYAGSGGRKLLQRIRLSTGDAIETYSATTPWNASPRCPHG